MPNPLHITVFGSSNPHPGEPAYEEALHLGSLLGQAGYTVLTGGYMGTMEAVSRGAAEAGAHVIGITCEDIEAWRPVSHNRWVHEERRFPTLRLRMYALIDACDAAIALPGGIGTLAEIAAMWNALQTRGISPRPLIVLGRGWERVFHTMFAEMGAAVRPGVRELLTFAADARGALRELQACLPTG